MEAKIQSVRNNIDDPIQYGISREIGYGREEVYQLNHNNVWDLTVTSNGVDITNSGTVYARAGQVLVSAPENEELVFKYKHAAFSNAEIEAMLTDLETVNAATLAAINQLLMSAAKRFDYRSGQTDMKASQVFDHLKQLKESYVALVDEESGSGVVKIATRSHRYYTGTQEGGGYDISRADSI